MGRPKLPHSVHSKNRVLSWGPTGHFVLPKRVVPPHSTRTDPTGGTKEVNTRDLLPKDRGYRTPVAPPRTTERGRQTTSRL